MFEYLMPNLWMKRFPDTLLDQTICAAVKCQRRYGAESKIPWGTSESASSAKTECDDYRYYAFGVPALAANPEQERAWVVAPYATLLALAVAPRRAIQNLQAQVERGWLGKYGFYEAADFSNGGNRETLVRIFMAHHHGMSLLALDNVLHGNCMQERFHREPMIEATALLLHERPARSASHRRPGSDLPPVTAARQRARTAA